MSESEMAVELFRRLSRALEDAARQTVADYEKEFGPVDGLSKEAVAVVSQSVAKFVAAALRHEDRRSVVAEDVGKAVDAPAEEEAPAPAKKKAKKTPPKK